MVDKNVKINAIADVIDNDMSIDDAVAKYGCFTASTLYRWVENSKVQDKEDRAPELKLTLSLLHRIVHRYVENIEDKKGIIEPKDLTGITNSIKMMIEYEHLTGEGVDIDMENIERLTDDVYDV